MPTDAGRALSLQEQRALELIAQGVADSASTMFAVAAAQGVIDDEGIKKQYALLIAGAMRAAAQTRVAYLQAFASANGEQPFRIPSRVQNPTPSDVLMPGVNPEGAVNNVVILRSKWAEEMREAQKALSESFDTGEIASRAVDRLTPEQIDFQATQMAAKRLGSLAESTMMSTTDFVDREVLGPDQRIAALRRVVHPGACDRCTTVAGVLVFKRRAQLRHDQCRCSFEPVFVNDPQYRERLLKYRKNAGTRASSGPGGTAWARGVRSRGRAQLAAADRRLNSEIVQDYWAQLLKSEQQRLGSMVKTINSNTYKDWAVMTSVKQAEIGRGLLPVITRK